MPSRLVAPASWLVIEMSTELSDPIELLNAMLATLALLNPRIIPARPVLLQLG
jgi:hypothetical protein